MAGKKANSNAYEEVRKQRVQENKKRFEDLGISEISKSLSKLSSPEKKQRLPKPKPESTEPFEPRRSSRARNTVTSYVDDLDIDLSKLRKRSKWSSSPGSYLARPLEEVKIASYEDRALALKAAEKFETNLQSENPTFVKSMVRSHVYSCFWLGLPTQFCKNHLPKNDVDITLEDENGEKCDARYLAKRTGLSGGWRGFALDKKLDDGDAVVFELVEPNRFKLYLFRISSLSGGTQAEDSVQKQETTETKKGSKRQKLADSSNLEETKGAKQTRKSKKTKTEKNEKSPNGKESEEQEEAMDEGKKPEKVKKSVKENGSASEEKPVEKKGNVAEANGGGKSSSTVEEKPVEQVKRVMKPRKKPAPRLFRKKV